ncbi:MAG: DUF4070 domain-containing protein, partial [Nostoc sp.]
SRTSAANIRKGLTYLTNILVRIGIFSNYRQTFWKMAKPALKAGNIENLIHIGLRSVMLLLRFYPQEVLGRSSELYIWKYIYEKNFVSQSSFLRWV